MAKQKKITELLKESSQVVNDFFKTEIDIPGGGKVKTKITPEDCVGKGMPTSAFTVRNLMKGKINNIGQLIEILNWAGYKVDEIVISKMED